MIISMWPKQQKRFSKPMDLEPCTIYEHFMWSQPRSHVTSNIMGTAGKCKPPGQGSSKPTDREHWGQCCQFILGPRWSPSAELPPSPTCGPLQVTIYVLRLLAMSSFQFVAHVNSKCSHLQPKGALCTVQMVAKQCKGRSKSPQITSVIL